MAAALRSNEFCKGGPRQCDASPDGVLRCGECQKTWLDQHGSAGTPWGDLLQRTLDLEFALSKRFQIALAKVPADEYLALQILDDERSRKEKEDQLLKKNA